MPYLSPHGNFLNEKTVYVISFALFKSKQTVAKHNRAVTKLQIVCLQWTDQSARSWRKNEENMYF